VDKRTLRQLWRFAIVGSIGFGVDAGLLMLISGVYGFDIYLSRLVSFLFATLATWWLNRRHTFGMDLPAAGDTHAREYARYIAVQIGGGFINLSVFSWLIYVDPRLRSVSLSILPVAAGSIAGMLWNYFGALRWVFRRQACNK
jgi:putative flippase GtrA